MNKEEIDQLYHLLRCVSNITGDINTTTGLTPPEEIGVYEGLCRHLLSGGDYLALVRFSDYYGSRFLVEPARKALEKTGWEFSRIVEFGAGTGWLGRGLSARLNLLPCLFVDKRPWSLTDVVADLETDNGRQLILEQLKPGDLIVASDALHCLKDPQSVMSVFSKWPLAAFEYCPKYASYRQSFQKQLARYGGNPIDPQDYMGMFPDRKTDIKEVDPYILLLVDRESS